MGQLLRFGRGISGLVSAWHDSSESKSGTCNGCDFGDPDGDIGGSGSDVAKVLKDKVGSECEGQSFVFVHVVKRVRPVPVDLKPGAVANALRQGRSSFSRATRYSRTEQGILGSSSAVMTKKERKHELTQRLGRAGDRPVAETPPRSAMGAGRKGVAKFRRFPAVGRESCDLKCTGREPSLAGRATTRPMARYERSMCRTPLYLQVHPRWPDGAEGVRTEPVGLEGCLLVDARSASGRGSTLLSRVPEPQGVKHAA